MSWASEIRQTLDMLSRVTDPAWQAEYRARLDQLHLLIAEVGSAVRKGEARKKLPAPPKPPKQPKKPKSPDADTVGTVKNIRPRRPFVHSVPPAGLPGGHR
jgi:hypothetical protein